MNLVAIVDPKGHSLCNILPFDLQGRYHVLRLVRLDKTLNIFLLLRLTVIAYKCGHAESPSLERRDIELA